MRSFDPGSNVDDCCQSPSPKLRGRTQATGPSHRQRSFLLWVGSNDRCRLVRLHWLLVRSRCRDCVQDREMFDTKAI